MNEYTASNGVTIRRTSHGYLSFSDLDLGALTGITLDEETALREYFEAHPERKAWRDADCGESWYLEPFDIVYTCLGNNASPDGLWFSRANVYGQVENIPLDDKRITAGRRIWPEDAS